MKWSQLKKRIEGNFAASVASRVEVWTTRYRGTPDGDGEGWVTIDKQRVSSMGTYTYLAKSYRETDRLRQESGCTNYFDPAQSEGYCDAAREADRLVKKEGHFALWDFNQALFGSLSLSIDDAIQSDNPIIRAFATLDRRFGKRRLRAFDDSGETALVQILYRFRCEVEGIGPRPEQLHAAPTSKSARGAAPEEADA